MKKERKYRFFSSLLMSFTLMYAHASLAQEKQPNVLIITADDMGFSDVGAFGSEIQTPTIDSIANEGLRFNNYY
ncbi:sulfatase-like hydrolase/transferase, partial [Vibrio splendidus]